MSDIMFPSLTMVIEMTKLQEQKISFLNVSVTI